MKPHRRSAARIRARGRVRTGDRGGPTAGRGVPARSLSLQAALDYFRAAHAERDARLDDALEVVLSERQAEGRWLLEATHNEALGGCGKCGHTLVVDPQLDGQRRSLEGAGALLSLVFRYPRQPWRKLRPWVLVAATLILVDWTLKAALAPTWGRVLNSAIPVNLPPAFPESLHQGHH